MSNIREIHGWVTIRYSFKNSEEADDLSDQHLPTIINEIAEKIKDLWFVTDEVRLVEQYGEHFLTVCGFSWHKSDADSCLSLYEFIAKVAKGSYGMLQVIDHDLLEVKNFVLKKGKIYSFNDSFFSPWIPEVEDEYTP